MTLSVPYSEDLGAIKEMVTAAAFSVPEVDSSQPPFFWIREFADYHIKVNMQFPTTLDGFWGTDVKVRTAIVNAFKKNNVSVTYPIGYAQGKYGVKDDNINSVVVEGETPPGS